MDTSVGFPRSGRCMSMIVSVRTVPRSPPVPRRSTSFSLRPVRESEPTSSQFVPEVFEICWSGMAAVRFRRASATSTEPISKAMIRASTAPQPGSFTLRRTFGPRRLPLETCSGTSSGAGREDGRGAAYSV